MSRGMQIAWGSGIVICTEYLCRLFLHRFLQVILFMVVTCQCIPLHLGTCQTPQGSINTVDYNQMSVLCIVMKLPGWDRWGCLAPMPSASFRTPSRAPPPGLCKHSWSPTSASFSTSVTGMHCITAAGDGAQGQPWLTLNHDGKS